MPGPDGRENEYLRHRHKAITPLFVVVAAITTPFFAMAQKRHLDVFRTRHFCF